MFSRRLRWRVCVFGVLVFLGFVRAVSAGEIYTLDQLLHLAREHHQTLLAGRDAVAAAHAGITTAGALPNPEVEYTSGSQRARVPGGPEGNVRGVWLSQRIEYPMQRQARIAAASALADASDAEFRVLESELLARLKVRYYELLRRQAELAAAQEDERLMMQIRRRVALKVSTGEAPRYESIKADAEALNAQKIVQSANARVAQAKASLRQSVGVFLADDFALSGQLEDAVPTIPTLAALRAELAERNPDLQRLRALRTQAEQQLEYERAQRLPALTLKGGTEQDSETKSSRFGIALPLPIFDRRQGQVATAVAQLSRARNELESQSFALLQAVEAAYQQHQIAASQVAAFESGIVQQAKEALRVAEAAYLYGERGILDYLDAQRVFRSVRSELIAARFDLQVAAIEIERLRANLLSQ